MQAPPARPGCAPAPLELGPHGHTPRAGHPGWASSAAARARAIARPRPPPRPTDAGAAAEAPAPRVAAACLPGQLHPTSSVSGKALSGTGAVEATRGRLGAVHTAETDRQPARAESGRPVGPGSQSVCISPLRRSDAANSGSVSKILADIFLPCGLGPPFRFFRGWGGSQNIFPSEGARLGVRSAWSGPRSCRRG